MTALLILLAAGASLVTAAVLCVLILNGVIALVERIDEWLARRG